MSSEERRKILQMVEEGRISAEEAAKLMRASTMTRMRLRRRSRSFNQNQVPALMGTRRPLRNLSR